MPRVVSRVHARSALSRALQLAGDDRAAAVALVNVIRPKAAALVERYWPAIERVARALKVGATLSEAEVDALIAATRTPDSYFAPAIS